MKSGPTDEFAVAGDGGTYRALEPSPPPDAPGSASRRPALPLAPWRAALPWASIAVVLVLAAVLVAPARAPEVSAWGRVADVTSRPEPAWSTEPADGPVRAALLAGGVLVAVSTGEVRGVSLDDGTTVWSRTLERPRCTSNGDNLICTEPGSRVLDLAPETGSIAREQAIPDVQLAAREAGDLYVVIGGEEPTLQRISGGETMWSLAVENVDRGPPMGSDLAVLAGHVLTTRVTIVPEYGSAAGAAVDIETGTPVGSDGDGGGVTVRRVAPGVWTSATSVWSATTTRSAAVYVRGEPEPHPIEPAAAPVGYDDQWDTPLQLRTAADGGVAVFDARSDSWLWQANGAEWPLARLDGALIGLNYAPAPHLVARDSESGELLWRHDDAVADCPCLADEHTLVVGTSDLTRSEGGFGVGPPQLVAIDARTGERVWQLETQGGWSALLSDGEHLIAVSPPGMRAWNLG